MGEEKIKSRREYAALWDRLSRYSLPRREGLRVRGDIFRQRAAAFVGWVKMRLFGAKGAEPEQRRQGGLLHRISAYRLPQRRRAHQNSEARVAETLKPWMSKRKPGEVSGSKG